MKEIRLLTPDDIEVRVAQTSVTEKSVKVSLLLYKNARVDMRILDEVFGSFGWKRTHRFLNDRLYCTVEVWDADKGEWVGKEDVGVESNTEAEKGQASDAFKRACVNWGIGRELYTAPRIRVALHEGEYARGGNGSVRVWTSFRVADIQYDKAARAITGVTIVDQDGEVRFSQVAPEKAAESTNSAETSKPAPSARKSGKSSGITQESNAAPQPAAAPAAFVPMDAGKRDLFVSGYARGKRMRSGADIRESYQMQTHAGPAEMKAFDDDVFRYKLANNIQ